MMLLGIVLHAGLTYNVTKHGNGWAVQQTEDTSLVTDFLVLLIHVFRMPAFFLIAGFFGALLFYERGVHKMVSNRIARLAWPFLVFLFLLTPFQKFCMHYTYMAYSGDASPWTFALGQFLTPKDVLPTNTSHLWFLYYLAMFTATGVVGALALERMPQFAAWLNRSVRRLFALPAGRAVVFSVIGCGLLLLCQKSLLSADNGFIPRWRPFIWFISFYAAGWGLYSSRGLLPSFERHAGKVTALAFGLVVARALLILWSGGKLDPDAPTPLMIAIGGFSTWLFVFGLTGLFLRHAAGYSPLMRYVSDASYWVYLLHLPLVIFFPGLIADWPLPALMKFLLTIIFTAVVCFATYDLFVRNTIIGRFLNGKKYPRGLPDARPEPRQNNLLR